VPSCTPLVLPPCARREVGGREEQIRRNQAFILQQIQQRVAPAVQQIAQQRGATVAVDANNIAWSSPAVDITPAQLDTARRLMAETGIEFPLVEASAEDVPLPDASFDLAISEYGASLWCDPARWLFEAARLLRPGGRLVFLTNSMLAILCVPDEPGYTTEQLLRPQKGMHRMTWSFEDGVEFFLGHGEWIDHLHAAGFELGAHTVSHVNLAASDPATARRAPDRLGRA